MPHLNVNGCNLYYEEHGDGPETIVFSHGLLWSTDLFKYQIEHLKNKYRIIAYDHRGQGKSEITKDGYDIENIYEDGKALVEKLGLPMPVHWAGLSMGGFVGMRLAARNPEMVKSLVLMNTGANGEDLKTKVLNSILCKVVNVAGIPPVRAEVQKTLFGKDFPKNKERADDVQEWTKDRLLALDRKITRAVKGIQPRKNILKELKNIKCATLIIAGDQDKAQKPKLSEDMHKVIENSRYELVKGAGHTGAIETHETYTKLIDEFLASN